MCCLSLKLVYWPIIWVACVPCSPFTFTWLIPIWPKPAITSCLPQKAMEILCKSLCLLYDHDLSWTPAFHKMSWKHPPELCDCYLTLAYHDLQPSTKCHENILWIDVIAIWPWPLALGKMPWTYHLEFYDSHPASPPPPPEVSTHKGPYKRHSSCLTPLPR